MLANTFSLFKNKAVSVSFSYKFFFSNFLSEWKKFLIKKVGVLIRPKFSARAKVN